MKILCGFLLLLLGAGGVAPAQFQNIRVNNASSTNPEEVTIAINPTDFRNLVGGANLRYFYRSTDGGLTWSEGLLTSPFGVYGDPCVIFDASGNAYYGHLSNPPGGNWLDRIVVQKSTDAGVLFEGDVAPGTYEIDLAPGNRPAGALAAGAYFLRLTTGSAAATRRIVLLK